MGKLAYICRQIFNYRQFLIFILTPFILSPLIILFENDDLSMSMRCAYCLGILVVYWSTQALPIAITALIPMVLYPMMSIAEASDVAPHYMSESNLAFIASVIVVDTIGQVGLHKRFSLAVLMKLGVKPRRLLYGFMLSTALIAMWLQNSVTTALMVPIVEGVTHEVRLAIHSTWQLLMNPGDIELMEKGKRSISRRDSVDNIAHTLGGPRFKNMLLLAVAYSSSIGGVATLIGTPTNLIMKHQVHIAFEEKGCKCPLNFFSWMVYALPISIIFVNIAYFIILGRYLGPAYAVGIRRGRASDYDRHETQMRETVNKMYKELPLMNTREKVVLVHVIVMILLMITRELDITEAGQIIGWEVIAPGYVKESTAAVLVAVSLYTVPITLPYKNEAGKWILPKPAASWTETAKLIPVGIVILIGGGSAAAYGAEASGLAEHIADVLDELVEGFSDWQVMLAFIIVIVFVTELMSNYACVSIMLPVFKRLAEARGSHPLALMLPTTVAASFAFMLPVATPPNAEVFYTSSIRLVDMMTTGFLLNVIGIGIVIGMTETLGNWWFHLDDVPWKIHYNATLENSTTIVAKYC